MKSFKKVINELEFEEEEIHERKMFNNICKISHSEKYSDENILKLF